MSPLHPFFGQFTLLFLAPESFRLALAEEAGQYLLEEAFLRRRLHKVVVQCMDCEDAQIGYLLAQGFTSDGNQREVLYSGGNWLNMESLSLFRAQWQARMEVSA